MQRHGNGCRWIFVYQFERREPGSRGKLHGFSQRNRDDSRGEEQQRSSYVHQRRHRKYFQRFDYGGGSAGHYQSIWRASIPLNGSTSLSFTIQNNNTTTTLTGVGFSDTLPQDWWFPRQTALPDLAGGDDYGDSWHERDQPLRSKHCGFIFLHILGKRNWYRGWDAEQYHRQRDFDGRRHGRNGFRKHQRAGPAVDAKVFNPSTISVNATTSLTFTLTNPAANVLALTGVAFTDTLPTGLTVANASPRFAAEL